MLDAVAATEVSGAAYGLYFSTASSTRQFDIVRLRPIEQRRYLVRASTSGPSAIGRVAVRTEFFNRAAIVGIVELLDDVTSYQWVCAAFARGCAFAAAVGCWARRRIG